MRTPVIPTYSVLRPLGIESFALAGGFWAERSASVLIGHCREWIDRTGWLQNFADRGGRGRVFADSEVYKLMEAMAWAGDPGFRELTGVVQAALEPDGYLNTKFGPAERYSDLEWGHELYCYGHLIQAGVAAMRSGLDGSLAMTVADHVCREFSDRDAYCGHPEIEMALVELYRVTGESRYLEQAKSFVDRRGHGRLGQIEFGSAYFQDDVTVREREAFSGHAVRELYLACGAVDVAVETGDDELLHAIARQWERTVAARTYVTGGMGARHEGESFGVDWELPSDGAYSETCAGIAAVMLSWRLLLATGSAKYADLIERVLYNVVATSPAPDGKSFFYANPLQQRVLSVSGGMSSRAVTGQRAPWFDVSCCPTNLARTFASLSAYLATASADGVQVHQYAAGQITVGSTVLTVETDYPWDGSIRVRIDATPDEPWTLSLRIPPWAGDEGYRTIRKQWQVGDEIVLRLPVEPRWTYPDSRIDAVRGCVAVESGPLVYCAEAPGGTLDLTTVDVSVPLKRDGVNVVGAGHIGKSLGHGWPYGPVRATEPEATQLTLVPYHLWATRGPSTMRVWLPLTIRTAT